MVPHRPAPGNDSLPHSVELVSGRARAVATREVAAALRELLARDVSTWQDAGWQRTRERTVRSVFTGSLAGVPVHVKLFRADTFADRVRDLVRRDRGAAEASNLLRAQCLGLPVVDALAHGFADDGGSLRSFVVTRTVPGAPFTFALPAAVQRRAGELLRTLHDRGLRHDDLHPGNLLVDDDGALHLLDLTSCRHGGDPGWRERARGLAFFCHELDGGAVDARARALLAGYEAAGALPPTFAAELALATRRWRAGALPAFGRRAMRACRHTEVSTPRRGSPRWCWHRFGDDAARRDACAQFAAAPPPPTKSGRRGAVWLLPTLVVKQRDAGKAKKLWRASYWLAFARVPAPAPVALRTFDGTGHVFTARVAKPSLRDELAAGTLLPHDVQAAARALGDSVGRLHAHGLGNRDLKFDNLVRNPHGDDVLMVDLDGVHRRAATDTRGRGADLGRLLAAFRAAAKPGGAATLRTFLGAYLRAHRTLLQQPPLRRVLRRAEQRAGEWASAHR